MKKIIFILPDLKIGGVTSSFINLIKLLNEQNNDFDITTLIMNGDENDYLSKKTKVLHLSGRARFWNLSKKSIKHFKRFKILLIGSLKKILNVFSLWNRYCFRKLDFGKFDYAIGYKQSPAVLDLIRVIDSKNKICFWHGDPNYMNGISKWVKKLSYVNKIACVSFYVKEQMLLMFPKYQDKLAVVMNNIDCDEITRKVHNQNTTFDKLTFNIITVSRISNEDKNIFIIPYIAQKLKEQNIVFKWRIVGSGPDSSELKRIIDLTKTNNVLEEIDSKNVFSYIAASDLFVLPSNTESFGMAILESLVLGVPCVCSDLASVREAAGSDNGVVFVDNTAEEYYKTIFKMIKCPSFYNDLLCKAKTFTYNSQRVYNQFCNLLNNETS